MAEIRLEKLTKHFDEVRAVDGLDLVAEHGSFIALLGPSGCGKTTTMNMIAGLERPTAGEIYFDDFPVSGLGPEKRSVGFVFQNYAIFTHMTVYENLAFGLRMRKPRPPKDEIDREVRAVARTVGLSEQLERRVTRLSVNDLQKAALGRSMIVRPAIFLLDEPFSNLDASFRAYMRAELKRIQHEIGQTMVYVTHDQVEAMSMADRILVLREGVVQQVGAPAEIYHRPANRFVATVVGSPPMNFLRATASWEEGTLRVSHPRFQVAAAAAHLRERLPEGAACLVAVRPEDVRVELAGEGMPATIYATEPLGGETIVDLNLDNRVVKAIASPALALSEDQEVRVHFEPRRLHLFAESGDALLSAAGEDVFAFTLAT